MTDVIIVTLSPKGVELARKLRRAFNTASHVDAAGVMPRALQKAFRHGRPLICIMSLELAARALGPVLQDPTSEPSVVVVDEAATVVVGFLGECQELTAKVASVLGSVPVMTAGGQSDGAPDVQLIGKRWGWKIEGVESLERVARVVQEALPVAVYQDAGRRDWWQAFGPWPNHFIELPAWPTLDSARHHRLQAILAISDRLHPDPPSGLERHTVLYRPPTLTLGVGCKRGTTCDELEDCVASLFRDRRLSTASITALAASSLKRQEHGLVEYADRHEIPFLAYPHDKLMLLGPMPAPSGRVRRRVTVASACEPAAMLAAGVQELVVPRATFPHLTLAVARRAVG